MRVKSKMGAPLSRFARLIKKPLQSQRSVDKVLESKPISAPKHASSVDAIERIRAETADDFKIRDSKDEQFLNILKDLKVESTDITKEKLTSSKNSTRKLPQERHSQGKITTTEVSKGKITTQNLTELFQKQMRSPEEWTAEKISGHYKLDEKEVESLLKYFGGYAVVQKRELPKPLEKVTFIE